MLPVEAVSVAVPGLPLAVTLAARFSDVPLKEALVAAVSGCATCTAPANEVTETLPFVLVKALSAMALASATTIVPFAEPVILETSVSSVTDPVAAANERFAAVISPPPEISPVVALSVTSSWAVTVPSSDTLVPFRSTEPLTAETLVPTVTIPPAVTFTLPLALVTLVNVAPVASVTEIVPLADAARESAEVLRVIVPLLAVAVTTLPLTCPAPLMLPVVALSATSEPKPPLAFVAPVSTIESPVSVTSPRALTLPLPTVSVPVDTLTFTLPLVLFAATVTESASWIVTDPLAFAVMLLTLVATSIVPTKALIVAALPVTTPAPVMPPVVALSETLPAVAVVVPVRVRLVPWRVTSPAVASTFVPTVIAPAAEVTDTPPEAVFTVASVMALASVTVMPVDALASSAAAAVSNEIEPAGAMAVRRPVDVTKPEPEMPPLVALIVTSTPEVVPDLPVCTTLPAL